MTNFSQRANDALVAWKARTPTLAGLDAPASPYAKSQRGPSYDVCLPAGLAAHNLLPDARGAALDRFSRLGIHWHDGTKVGPSNHLRSSQVQCVNALMPFVQNPEAIKALLGQALPIAEVLPFGDPEAPGDHVVFEWIGLDDYLHEGNGKTRTRGANTTSVDAAIRYRTPDGDIEIGLIEWKYTEAYPTAPKVSGPKNVTRRKRYDGLWGSVVRTDLLDLDDLFVEPIYQLLRQQMLAHEMEQAGELGAAAVRVVYAAPAANASLWSSLPTTAFRTVTVPAMGEHATDVRDLWDALRLEPDRFVWLDTARFVAPDAPTSLEFKDRYGHLAPLAAVG